VNIIWAPEAKEDFKRLYAFIYPHNPGAAAKLVQTLFDSAETIRAHPKIGKPYSGDPLFRDFITPFGARAYVLRYRSLNNDIFITRIWHSLENH